MSGKVADPEYDVVVNTEEESTIQVVWKDDMGNVIVAGEKKVRGGQEEAMKVTAAFAQDLRKNFADRFPVEEPAPMDGEDV